MSFTIEHQEIKQEIKEEKIEDYEAVNKTLEENIDDAVRTGTLGLAGQ